MSRHRNVRSTNFYSEECDGFDDVYGHSVEDDYCVSPSVAEQFIYDRSRRPQMSVFLGQEEEIAEEDEEEDGEEENQNAMGDVPKKPMVGGAKGLSDMDQARLQSCLEEVRNVVGDSIAEQMVIDAVLTSGFDVEKALNMVLNSATRAGDSGALKTKADQGKEKDVCSNCNSYSSPRSSNSDAPSGPETFLTLPPSESVGCCSEEDIVGSSMLEGELEAECSHSSRPTSEVPSEVAGSPLSSLHQDSGGMWEEGSLAGRKVISAGKDQEPMNLCAPSDSEDEEDFPSLHSLVIHNTSAHGLVSPSSGTDRVGGALKKDNSSTVEWSHCSAADAQVGAGDDSEDSEDGFSSLCSLVVHNRSKKGSMLPEPSIPFIVPTLVPPLKMNVESKVAGPPRPPSPTNSSSEEEDFSSLHSLVICNRSAPVENETNSMCRGWAQTQSLPPKGAGDDCAGGLIPKRKVLEVNESDSEEEEDNYSSLCSLVIHNRNSPFEGPGKAPVSSPAQKPTFVVPSGESGENVGIPKQVRGMHGGSFVIPPLLVKPRDGAHPVRPSLKMESEESGEEEDDYVIDLCGTLKTLDVESISSVEELETQDDLIKESVPLKIEDGAKREIEWSIIEEGCIHEPIEGTRLLDVNSRKLSPFGRILCKNWECLKQLDCPGKGDTVLGSGIMAFLFDKESPDDICRRLRAQKYLVQVKAAKVTS